MKLQTLNEVLQRLGYRTRPGIQYGKYVYNEQGELIGHFTAGALWDYLKERALI